jgi:hypothetical protein
MEVACQQASSEIVSAFGREREREQEGHPHGIELKDLDVFREASSSKSFMRF